MTFTPSTEIDGIIVARAVLHSNAITRSVGVLVTPEDDRGRFIGAHHA